MISAKAHSHADRGDDFYPTPREAVEALLRIETLPQVLWEPACGDGAIVMPLRATGRTVVATDKNDYGCPGSVPGVDFLRASVRPVVEGIVTNPPYKIARPFVEQAVKSAPYVAMLLRLAFLEGTGRREWLETSGLARVHVSSRRLPMMHRHGWEGPKSTSTTAYAWFVWERGHTGPAEIRLFDWKSA